MNPPVGRIRSCVMPIKMWTPPTSEVGGFRYVDIGSVDREAKCVTGATDMSTADAPSRARQILKADDVLVSTVRPNLNAVALVPASLDGAVGSTGFTVLRADQKCLRPRYLFHWVRTPTFVTEMVKKATGASYPAVSDRIVLDSYMPLPEVDEQDRVANILDKADAICSKRRATTVLTMDFLRSAFLEMFGDPVTNPRGWPVVPLGELVEIRGGGTPSRTRQEYFCGSIPWATAKDFVSDVMTDTQEHVSEDAIAASATQVVPVGTVLIVVKSKILMRRLPIAVATVPLCFNQDVKGLVVRSAAEGTYIATHLRLAQRRVLELARGVNTEGLTVGHLRGQLMMKPPDDLIERFAKLDAKRLAALHNQRAALCDTTELLKALVARAFSGRL